MSSENIKSNMLSGSMWDKILLFALPIAATGILQQIFNAADLAVVGRLTGESGTAAQAAVSVNSPVVGLTVNLFAGLSLGTNVVIAGAVGRNDSSTIKKATHTSVLFAVICGLIAAVIGYTCARPILNIVNVPDDVLPMAMTYLRIYLFGLPAILLYNYEAAILRAVGNTKIPLFVLAASGVINVGLNFFFVAVLKMTVDGVATATVISNAISALSLLVYLLKTDMTVKLNLRELRIEKQTFLKIVKIGLPAGLQAAVFSFANLIVQSAINSLDTVVIAASGAAFNIEIFAYFVLNSFSQACTTFVGQNCGARRPDRCNKALKLCILEGAVGLLVSSIAILLFGKEILSLFNKDPAVIETGFLRLEYVFVAYIFALLYECTSGYLRGFGISLTPAVLTMLGVCGVRLSWIFFVFPQNRVFSTILTVFPLSLATTAVFIGIAALIIRPARKCK